MSDLQLRQSEIDQWRERYEAGESLADMLAEAVEEVMRLRGRILKLESTGAVNVVAGPLKVERDRYRAVLADALDWMEHASSMPEAERIAALLRGRVHVA